MPTIEQQLALRDRLQAVEDELVAAGQHHVTIEGTQGVFTWIRRKAYGRHPELVVVEAIHEIEDMIVTQDEWAVMVATDFGVWTWRPRSAPAPKGGRSRRPR